MKNNTFFLFLFSISFIFSQQQEKNKNEIIIQGTVIDGNTKQPLEYATVILKNKETSLLSGGLTDFNGNFKIATPQATYEVSVKYISFKSKIFPVEEININKKFGIIALYENTNSLNEIVIVAEKTTVDIRLDKKIFNIVRKFNGKAILTSKSCLNGTERIAEGYELINKKYDLIHETIKSCYVANTIDEFEKMIHNRQLLTNSFLINKKKIPYLPSSIGVITSPDASVLRDVISTLERRNKSLEVIIYPTPVQGKMAPQGIIEAIQLANQRDEVDVLIICRGGGSIEDLWSFNDELVAREIFSSNLPIVSAVGHQTDITISDFVADLRAPTPTAAAEIVSKSYEELLGNLEYFKSNLLNLIQNKIEQLTQRIDFLEKGLVSPIQKIVLQFDLISGLKNRMQITINSQLEKYREQIKSYKQNLSHLNPNEILSRGYSIVLNQNKKIINNASAVSVSDKIKIKFHEGNAEASITIINQDKEL